jgi:hypothetical protein
MHKRTFTRAAGVSPPWVQLAPATAGVFVGSGTTVRRASRALFGGNRTGNQERRASARRGCNWRLQRRAFLSGAIRRYAAGVGHHSAKIGPRNKSGGREPAVVSETVFATGIVYRGVIAFRAHDQRPHHGGLTPPAPGCVCGRYCRCAIPYTGTLRLPRGADAPRSWVHGVRCVMDAAVSSSCWS